MKLANPSASPAASAVAPTPSSPEPRPVQQQQQQHAAAADAPAAPTVPPLPTSASALQSLSRQFVPLGDRSDVSILVCGDEGVGKTSIIEALLSRSFKDSDDDYGASLGQPSLDRQWSVAHIPAELDRHRGADIDLQDTLTKRPTEKLKDADVVVLVYDATSDETFDHAVNFWLGMIKRRCKRSRRSLQAATISVLWGIKSTGGRVERELPLWGQYQRETKRKRQQLLRGESER